MSGATVGFELSGTGGTINVTSANTDSSVIMSAFNSELCCANEAGALVTDPATFATFDELFGAFEAQVRHVLNIKIRGNQLIERLYATRMPHTFLSVITDDCIARGKDYNAGGARYNNTFIQAVGIGSITDSLSALKDMVFDQGDLSLGSFVKILGSYPDAE